ncbi:FHF complex subunit HOOK-interacting protein 1B-like [Anguilla rostrata]|uniref:FHF complex subunit HOOK-interacting protein 1B-like n=1 Tax=Anguilla rostrata TaxID=7938 RepID=UPI0030D626B4
MSWLSRLTPRGHGSRANRDTSPSSPVIADPETCLMVFQNHWRQVSWVLEQQHLGGSGVEDELTAVRNHTDQMMCLLAEEQPAGAAPGPILEMVLKENVLDRLLQWHLRCGLSPNSQGALLKLFEVLIGQGQQPLLQHKPVLQPLLSLLTACADPVLGCPPALEGSLVLLLNQVCVCMAQQAAVLELLLHATPGPAPQSPAPLGPSPQVIFSLLVPFIHREGSTGQQARDALLLVMATSASNQAVAHYITENSYFCQVLAAGLSALYSSLPRKLEVRDDDWHALRHEDWVGVSSLALLMNSLEFCNAVVQVSHPLVRSQLLDYIHSGFLEPVIGPALHKSSVEEMIASTAYLDLFLRSVTETDLLKTFLRFILLDRHDNDTIIDTLLTRISSNSRLCMVSLSLFRTLLSLNCEDLMLQLILRYLLPCTHVMLSQRPAVRGTDLYGKSADKFLSLIPECCRLDTAPPGDQEDDGAQWGKALERPSMESAVPPKPSTPSRLALFIRSQGSGPDRAPTRPRGDSSPPASEGPLQWVPEAAKGLEWEYLTYLRDARKGVELCAWGCRDWSAPYDGVNPSPNSAPPPPPPPTAMPTLVMVPEHFSLHPVAASAPPPAALSSAPVPTALPDSGQQGAEAVGPGCSGSNRDDGEWDVTINEKRISLTSHSNKRSLQHLVPVTHDAPSPPLASIPQSPLPLSNGVGPGGVVSLSQNEGMEVKKLKRELGDGCSPAEGGQDWVTGGPPGSCQAVGSVLSQGSPSQSTHSPLTASSLHEMDTSKSLESAPNQNSGHTPEPIPAPTQNSAHTPEPIPAPTQDSTHTSEPIPAPTQSSTHTSEPIPVLSLNSAPAQSCTPIPGPVPAPTPSARPPWAAAMSQGLESVDSLIKELLERTPMALQGGDSEGHGISIEAFHQELQELEDRVRPLKEHSQDPAPGPVPTATEQEEDPPPTALDSEPKSESSAKEVCRTLSLGQPLGLPYTGPFMAVVFSKLECMLQNSLYVNILLTGILARLACYPQPLLRSFLLNTNVVFQPSVKSLVQVLGSVKTRIEAFAAAQENFPDMLRRARQYLVARGKLDWTDPLGLSVPNLRRSDSLVKSRKPSLGDLILRHTQSPVRARQAAQQALAHVRGGALGGGAPGLEKQAEALRVKNAVYSAVVFSEFLKELAALAQEHAVAMPFPPSQGAEE